MRVLWVALLICFGFSTLRAAETPNVASINLTECRLSSKTSGAVAARCGWYSVKEDRSNVASKTVRIRVAVIPALRQRPLADPVFVISGGPGQAATDFYLSSRSSFERLRRNRDLVVIDQRGTGQSHRLDCEFPDDLESKRLDSAILTRYAHDCVAKLDADPRFYTTSVAVLDLDEIRAALGYEVVNLYGISYGTRVAQHYVRRFASHVRTVVLDGVVPVGVALGPEVAPAAQKALDSIFARCATDVACEHAFGNVAEQFAALRTQLNTKAIPLNVPDPKTAQTTHLDWGISHLAVATRLLSYSDATASLLPLLVNQASHGQPQAIAAEALMVARSVNEQIANGMHNAVVCTEDVPFFDKALLNSELIDQSYLGRVFVDALQAMCRDWPQGLIDADFHQPFLSDVPALLLSGGNDPVTPAVFGEQAARSFSRGVHVVMPDQGHGQLNLPCGSLLIAQFVEAGDSKKLQSDCVALQRATPFMLTPTGPGP